MLYPPEVMLAELRHFPVLEDFDIVMTGTPAGVGATAGERFHGRVLEGELVSGAKKPSKLAGSHEFSLSDCHAQVFQYRQRNQ